MCKSEEYSCCENSEALVSFGEGFQEHSAEEEFLCNGSDNAAINQHNCRTGSCNSRSVEIHYFGGRTIMDENILNKVGCKQSRHHQKYCYETMMNGTPDTVIACFYKVVEFNL